MAKKANPPGVAETLIRAITNSGPVRAVIDAVPGSSHQNRAGQAVERTAKLADDPDVSTEELLKEMNHHSEENGVTFVAADIPVVVKIRDAVARRGIISSARANKALDKAQAKRKGRQAGATGDEPSTA